MKLAFSQQLARRIDTLFRELFAAGAKFVEQGSLAVRLLLLFQCIEQAVDFLAIFQGRVDVQIERVVKLETSVGRASGPWFAGFGALPAANADQRVVRPGRREHKNFSHRP